MPVLVNGLIDCGVRADGRILAEDFDRSTIRLDNKETWRHNDRIFG